MNRKGSLVYIILAFAVLLSACVTETPPVSESPPLITLAPQSTEPTPEPDMSFVVDAENVTCSFGEVSIPMLSADIETVDAVFKQDYIVSDRMIYVELYEDFSPVFSREPDEWNAWALDREGAPLDECGPGIYELRVFANYEGADWSGTLTFTAHITVLGDAKLTASADSPLQGDVLSITVTDAVSYCDYRVYLRYLDIVVNCVRIGDTYDGTAAAVLPVNVTAPIGATGIELQRSKHGSDFETVMGYSLDIGSGEFVRQDLQTSTETQALYTNENLNSDNEKTRAARANPIALPYFTGKFTYPLPEVARVTTEFGQERYVNGSFQSRHSGVDLAAYEGTDIYAVSTGRVVLADELIVNGNTVIIDHGMGVYSAYSHMSEMSVEVGDIVEQGIIIGKVGSTGYSTGPHLHFTITVSGYYVNPFYPIENNLLDVYK